MNNRAVLYVVLFFTALVAVLISREHAEGRNEPSTGGFEVRDPVREEDSASFDSPCRKPSVGQTVARSAPDSSPEQGECGSPEPKVPTIGAAEADAPAASTDPGRPDMSAVAERKVRKFNAETDRWVKGRPVTVADIQAFGDGLKAVPPSRRVECLRRALNLIPDANVGLLAGVVLDKTQDTEIVETTFRDIANRPEEVKEPILEAIAKDKTHPCYSDVEWIYEVTGEKPAE